MHPTKDIRLLLVHFPCFLYKPIANTRTTFLFSPFPPQFVSFSPALSRSLPLLMVFHFPLFFLSICLRPPLSLFSVRVCVCSSGEGRCTVLDLMNRLWFPWHGNRYKLLGERRGGWRIQTSGCCFKNCHDPRFISIFYFRFCLIRNGHERIFFFFYSKRVLFRSLPNKPR